MKDDTETETKIKKDEDVPVDSEAFELEFNENGEEDFKKTLKKLKADLKSCQTEKQEYLTGWQKERAEFSNYRKQENEKIKNLSEVMQENILVRFLTVLDSFNMAFSNTEVWNQVDENWRKGIEHIYTQLNSIFKEYNVKEIGKIGENFNPNIHQSIETTPTDDKEKDHQVSLVVQRGYKLDDHILRVAQVHVFKYEK